MKLVQAIVSNKDSNQITSELSKNDFSVTRLSTTGGFLKKGNTTLLIVTTEELVDKALAIIKEKSTKRKTVTDETIQNTPNQPKTVMVGGATVFVLDVVQFDKI